MRKIDDFTTKMDEAENEKEEIFDKLDDYEVKIE